MHGRMVTFISIIQAILFAVHWFVYATWMSFTGTANAPGVSVAKIILGLLSVSFVITSLLAFRYSNTLIRILYTISAVWLGMLSFFFLAASLSWLTYAATVPLGLPFHEETIALFFFVLAACASAYAIINALWIRVRRISVKLPNLPESWRGRVAALVSDVHLGHIRGRGFTQRIVHMLSRLRPDVVFITGDLFDGTSANLEWVTKPWCTWRHRWARFSLQEITKNSLATQNTSTPSGHLVFAYWTTKRYPLTGWIWLVCIMGLFFIPRPSAPFCGRLRSTPSALAFCWHTLPINCGSRKRKASPCNFPATRTVVSSSLGPGSPLAFMGRSCTG